MGTYDIYTVINSNEEGYNLLGIFHTEEAANAAAEKYNLEGKEEIRELFKDDSEAEIKKHLEFFDWWSSAEVVVEQMNSMRSR